MRAPATQLLDTALALHRAPGERFRLRERPVPPDLVHVLEVAAGSPQALATAAAQLGEPEDVVLEATRFYLEQILFADQDADAYRILGVLPDAPADLIRTHHRWLQRWLHPDRAQAGDASVYATRVNQAWAVLRTPESRHQYDVRLAEARLAGATAPLPAATVRYWEGEETLPSHGARSRWLLGAALVACAVLAFLIVRHEQGPEPWVPGETALAAVEEPQIDRPAIEDRDLGILTEALAAATASPPVEPVAARAAPTSSIPTRDIPARDIAEVEAVAARAAPTGDIATSALPARDIAEVEPVAARAAPTREIPATVIPTRDIPTRDIPTRDIPTRDIAKRALPRNQLVGAAPAATPAPAPAQVEVALKTPAEHGAAAPQPPTLLLERMHLAEQRVAQLTAYLAAQPGAAPLWNDLQTAQHAERIRARIAARSDSALELARPNWQLQTDNATLRADYTCAGCRVRQGRIDVQLVWREGLWLVRSVDLAPSA